MSAATFAVALSTTPAFAEEGWEGANNGICFFKSSSDTSDELTEELNFQFKPSLRSGDALTPENFRVHDVNGLLGGLNLHQLGFNGQVMTLVSRSDADVAGSPVVGVAITISNPPQKYNVAAVIRGTVGASEPGKAMYVGRCMLEQHETGADLAWQAMTKETSKPK